MANDETTATTTNAANELQVTPVSELRERYPELEHFDEQDDEERIGSFRSILSGLQHELDNE